MNSLQWKMDSLIGPLYLVASPRGLQGIFWKKQPEEMLKSLAGESLAIPFLIQAEKEISEYLQGSRKKFTIKFDVTRGTPFQKRVWEELSKIPYGQTLSYKQLAEKINSRAIRAVGSANGKNPLSLMVPCHRVIASDGTLGGYAGGLKIKAKLLEIERFDS